MKRIKKVSTTTPTQAQVVDGHSNSTTDSYSCNYVNGKVEDIDTDIAGINTKLGTLLKQELLWTNSSSSSAFEGQTITLSKSCEKVDIIYKTTKSDANQYVRTVYNLNAYGCTLGLVGYKLCNRNVALNNNQVHFGNCEYIGTYGSASVNNDYMIPYKIIGYTTVS